MTRLKTFHSRKAFTLIELVITAASAAILTVVIGILLADGQRNWNRLYERTYSDSTIDGFATQKVFDTVCRKSSLTHYKMSSAKDSLQLYYWDSDSSSETPENYARFYLDGDDLCVEHGKLESGTWQEDTREATRLMTLAKDVETVKFKIEGLAVQMFLTSQDPEVMPVICSSVRHNK